MQRIEIGESYKYYIPLNENKSKIHITNWIPRVLCQLCSIHRGITHFVVEPKNPRRYRDHHHSPSSCILTANCFSFILSTRTSAYGWYDPIRIFNPKTCRASGPSRLSSPCIAGVRVLYKSRKHQRND